MTDQEDDHGHGAGPGRQLSWLERTILPPRKGEHWIVRELKGLARVGIIVIPILLLIDVGRVQGWW